MKLLLQNSVVLVDDDCSLLTAVGEVVVASAREVVHSLPEPDHGSRERGGGVVQLLLQLGRVLSGTGARACRHTSETKRRFYILISTRWRAFLKSTATVAIIIIIIITYIYLFIQQSDCITVFYKD